jgi:hypothetical protein
LLMWKISFLIFVNFFKNVLSLSLLHIFKPVSIFVNKVDVFFKSLTSFILA